MKASQMKPENQFVGMFVGKAGCGKSTAAASFAEIGPMKVMDFDKRINGIYHAFSYLPPEVRANLEYQQYSIESGFKEPAEELGEYVEQSKKLKCPYKTIQISSAGIMANSFVDEYSRLVKGVGVRRVGQVDMTSPAHFNYASRAMHKIVYEGFRELRGVHFILDCWVLDRWGKPPDAEDYAPNEVIGTKLNLTDKLSEEVPGYFDEVYEFDKREVGGRVTHHVRFRSSIAKTAFPMLPAGWHDITNKSFYQLWKGYIDGTIQPKPAAKKE